MVVVIFGHEDVSLQAATDNKILDCITKNPNCGGRGTYLLPLSELGALAWWVARLLSHTPGGSPDSRGTSPTMETEPKLVVSFTAKGRALWRLTKVTGSALGVLRCGSCVGKGGTARAPEAACSPLLVHRQSLTRVSRQMASTLTASGLPMLAIRSSCACTCSRRLWRRRVAPLTTSKRQKKVTVPFPWTSALSSWGKVCAAAAINCWQSLLLLIALAQFALLTASY